MVEPEDAGQSEISDQMVKTGSPEAALPPLNQDPSFWGLLLTQFLGAFNDNLFKQIVLFVCVERALHNPSDNLQGVATFAFALPFVLLSGGCGVLSDRYGKRGIIVLSKVLEIVVMLAGAVAFATGSLASLIVVLFFMGAQSALFGPSKYGILPELFRSRDLPQANGWILMTTFLSIILGGILAGLLKVVWDDRLWLSSVVCTGIAIVGTLTALPIRRTPVANPDLAFSAGTLFVAPDMRRVLWDFRELRQVVFVSSVFWCVAALYQLGINDLGILQLGLQPDATAYLAAWAAIGIAIGGSLSGQLAKGRFDARLVMTGLWGMIISLVLLGMPGPARGGTLLGLPGSAIALAILGCSAGIFAVPLSVYAQAMTPGKHKGQIIGVMNLCNWIGILGAAGIHLAYTSILDRFELPNQLIFLAAASLLGIVAFIYRPKSIDLHATTGASTAPAIEL